MVTVECEVSALRRGQPSVRVAGLLVDPHAEFTWLPKSALIRAGIGIGNKRMAFVLADGRIVKRCVGYAMLRADGFESVDEVVFADLGDVPVLGSRTLDGFGAIVDDAPSAPAIISPWTRRLATRASVRPARNWLT